MRAPRYASRKPWRSVRTRGAGTAPALAAFTLAIAFAFATPAGAATIAQSAGTAKAPSTSTSAESNPAASQAQASAVPNANAPHSGHEVPGTMTSAAAQQDDPPQSSAQRLADLTSQRAPVTPASSTISPELSSWSGQFHGYWGTDPSVVDYGAQATQSVNPNVVLPSTDTDVIYSPTLYPTGASCIEVSTVYSHTGDAVNIWDWCASKPGFVKGDAVNSSFLSTYTTTLSGQPYYTVQDVLTNPTNNTWTVYLFNYTTGAWDTFDSISGSSGGTNLGWDMNEMYTSYNASTGEGDYCTQTYAAAWSTFALQYLPSYGGAWVAADPSNSSMNLAYPRGSDMGCANSDFWLPTANSNWKVTNSTHGAGELIGTGSNKCVDTNGNSFANGTKEQIWDCNGGAGQSWTYNSLGELTVDGGAYCLDAAGQGTTSGTKVDLYQCNGGTNQEWSFSIKHTLVGIQSGLCLDVTNYGTTDGSQLQLWTCNDTTNQQWQW